MAAVAHSCLCWRQCPLALRAAHPEDGAFPARQAAHDRNAGRGSRQPRLVGPRGRTPSRTTSRTHAQLKANGAARRTKPVAQNRSARGGVGQGRLND
jgi:hypothetical protein